MINCLMQILDANINNNCENSPPQQAPIGNDNTTKMLYYLFSVPEKQSKGLDISSKGKGTSERNIPWLWGW